MTLTYVLFVKDTHPSKSTTVEIITVEFRPNVNIKLTHEVDTVGMTDDQVG